MTDLMRMDHDGPIGILRFLPPAIPTVSIVDALTRKLDEAERDSTICTVVMTGGEHFSIGGDLVGFRIEIAKGARATHELVDRVHEGWRATYRFRKLLVAAVDGVAFRRQHEPCLVCRPRTVRHYCRGRLLLHLV